MCNHNKCNRIIIHDVPVSTKMNCIFNPDSGKCKCSVEKEARIIVKKYPRTCLDIDKSCMYNLRSIANSFPPTEQYTISISKKASIHV